MTLAEPPPRAAAGPDPYGRMVDILRWRPDDRLLDGLHEGHVDRLSLALGRAFAADRHFSPDRRPALDARFDDLQDDAAARLICAPETYERLVFNPRPAGELAAFLEDGIRAELPQRPDRPCWTALGDRYDGAGCGPAANPFAEDWAPDRAWRAPAIGFGAVPVDAWSPWARTLNSLEAPFAPYPPQELASIVAGLDTAARGVAVTDLSAAFLFLRFAKVVVVRNDATAPEQWGSSSTHSHVGRIVLSNPHLVDVSVLANALVHESIHAALYVIEQTHPMVRDEALARDSWVRSPWSGNPLPLRTYIHACFVWYGLAAFWRRALAVGSFPRAASEGHLQKALSGFEVGDPLGRTAPFAGNITAQAAAAVDRLRGRALSGAEA